MRNPTTSSSPNFARFRETPEALWPGLYQELHKIAAAQAARERPGSLLQTTAIVHEAYLRLASQDQRSWRDRQSFFAAAAVTMRRVLVDSARSERAEKRGGKVQRQALDESRIPCGRNSYSAVDVNEALERLMEFAPEEAKALELMIFAGMTGEEIASLMGLSASTIDRRIRSGKAWLRSALS